MSYHPPFPDPPPRHGSGAHRARPGSAGPAHGSPHPGRPAGYGPWAEPAADTWADPAAGTWAEPARDPWAGTHGTPLGTPRAPGPADERGAVRRLGSAYRLLRRVATLTALGYFVLYLLLSAYAPGLMTGSVSGGLTTGVLLGLVQLPVALGAIALYEAIARRRVDPLAAGMRERAAEAAADDERTAARRAPGGAFV
ncbi:DUF485 domain-containing protein [Streptomyces sp. C10-9-1]|uniref:DUF485 domain-containing protein n=1 Tax=Streptomyces sp. C10-9-1 TaxID=1859285 RepID=UPI002111069C|nr:DUF485 domain-containing protein [Streptomyces sp. C10-9-1]MCQ6555624.1 DUF485 domain-containing protein [Streptomyces sp. C10-9-1]